MTGTRVVLKFKFWLYFYSQSFSEHSTSPTPQPQRQRIKNKKFDPLTADLLWHFSLEYSEEPMKQKQGSQKQPLHWGLFYFSCNLGIQNCMKTWYLSTQRMSKSYGLQYVFPVILFFPKLIALFPAILACDSWLFILSFNSSHSHLLFAFDGFCHWLEQQWRHKWHLKPFTRQIRGIN